MKSSLRLRLGRGSLRISISLACFLLLFFIGLQFPVGAAEPKRGGALIVAIEGEEGNLNPHLVTGSVTQMITSNIFNFLVYMDFDFKIIPELAESWRVSKDGLTYTFNLVKNASWHDGKPFTAADILYTFDHIFPNHPRAGVWWKPNVTSVEAPDPYTVVIRLKQIKVP